MLLKKLLTSDENSRQTNLSEKNILLSSLSVMQYQRIKSLTLLNQNAFIFLFDWSPKQSLRITFIARCLVKHKRINFNILNQPNGESKRAGSIRHSCIHCDSCTKCNNDAYFLKRFKQDLLLLMMACHFIIIWTFAKVEAINFFLGVYSTPNPFNQKLFGQFVFQTKDILTNCLLILSQESFDRLELFNVYLPTSES